MFTKKCAVLAFSSSMTKVILNLILLQNNNKNNFIFLKKDLS